MNKNLVIGLLAALVLGSLFVAFNKAPSQVLREVRVGSVASPDIQSAYFSYGTVRHWAARDTDLTQATTTVCALQSPAATSTLKFGSIRLDVSSTTGSTVTMAKAATAYATTTFLGSSVVAANAFVTLVATSSLPVGSDIFGPNQFLVVGMADGTPEAGPGTFSPTGVCSATWVEN